MPAETVEVDFRPRLHGWHFPNRWPAGAPAGFAGFTLGRVYGGLCGGMCVTAARAWQDGSTLAPGRSVPTDGPITTALWSAQLDSMDLPDGPLRYLRLQLPVATSARRRSTLGEAIPAVRRALRAGRPAPLGLVRALSWSPGALGQHHVVLAYRWQVRQTDRDRPADEVQLSVYDPNYPDDDGVRLRITPDGSVAHNRSRRPVHALVRLGSGSRRAMPG